LYFLPYFFPFSPFLFVFELLSLETKKAISLVQAPTMGQVETWMIDELSFFFFFKNFLNLKKRLQNSLVSKFYIQNGIHELRDATFPNKVNYGNNQGHQVPL